MSGATISYGLLSNSIDMLHRSLTGLSPTTFVVARGEATQRGPCLTLNRERAVDKPIYEYMDHHNRPYPT